MNNNKKNAKQSEKKRHAESSKQSAIGLQIK